MDRKKTGMKCSVKYCRNKVALTKNVNYFNYPKHVPTRIIWIYNCQTQYIVDPDPDKKCSYRVCSDHFEPSMFINNTTSNRLAFNAVPTIFNDEISSMRKNEEMSEMIDIAEHQTSFHDNSILMNSTLALSPTQDTHAPTNHTMTSHVHMLNKCKTLLPVLSHNLHKGQSGRIGVIGGCEEYTGAPYYAAISALRTGADIVYVFCFKSAASVIKSFSPEFIVLPYLDSPDCINLITPWLEKLHSLVVGPGLGTSLTAQDAVKNIFEHISRNSNFNNKRMPIIADADSLNVIEPETFRNYNGCVYLTPNVHELTKLSSRLIGRQTYEPTVTDVQALMNTLGGNYVIVLKGAEDIIANKRGTLVCTEQGSTRRCGGQGDVLAGSMSTFAYWASKQTHYCDELDPEVLAAYAASALTRHTNKLAFKAKGRNMITTDIVELLPNAFQTLFDN